MKLPQLSLRDLFWFLALLGCVIVLGCGGLLNHFAQEQRFRRAQSDFLVEAAKVHKLSEELESLGYKVNQTEQWIEVIKPDGSISN